MQASEKSLRLSSPEWEQKSSSRPEMKKNLMLWRRKSLKKLETVT